MDPWTADDRNAFIAAAKNCEEFRGQKGPYYFNVLPKVTGGNNDQEDVRKSMVTEALAKTIYNTNPAFRCISLAFYNILYQKLAMNQFTGPFMNTHIVLLKKGSNAYAYITEERFPEVFSFSDLDIVIYINPFIDNNLFAELDKAVKVTVVQTISQYKRLLDHMLFLDRPIDGVFLSPAIIAEFKDTYNKMLADITLPDDSEILSPFVSNEVRNACSRNSFFITNSEKRLDSVVRVEVPHYDRCDRIPLRKTPLFTSYNETIDFMRTDNPATNMVGQFDLYRIRWNNLYVERDESGNVVHQEKITADFIDVSVAAKNDSELIDFWTRGRFLCLFEKNANIWFNVPDIYSCISDLYKMLNIYECPESKKQKRTQKYNKLVEIAQHVQQISMMNTMMMPPPPAF